jgi:uncharacterized protein (TIGR03435 family)
MGNETAQQELLMLTRFFAALAVVAIVTGVRGEAQSPTTLVAGKHLVFDAASIKPSKSLDETGATIFMGQRGGHVAINNFSLRMLLGSALHFDLNTAKDSILGMPGWGDSERFDIVAEAPGDPSVEEKHLMLLSLLADRFKLVFHQETRQRPIFGLVAVKPGSPGNVAPQLRLHTDDTACQAFAPGRAAAPSQTSSPARSPAAAAAAELEKRPCGRVFGGLLDDQRDQAWAGGRGVTMQAIVESFGSLNPMPRPVRDRTGIEGTFDFTVVWNPRIQDFSPEPQSEPGLSLLDALREQDGLKLEPQTGPVDVMFVDHVEHPTEN